MITVCAFIDIDECSAGYHECSHECENLNGTHRCVCNDGYMLQANERDCEGTYYVHLCGNFK